MHNETCIYLLHYFAHYTKDLPSQWDWRVHDGVTLIRDQENCGSWWAHDMLVNPGAVLETDFPYVASDVACGGPIVYPYHLVGWAYVDKIWDKSGRICGSDYLLKGNLMVL